jgi:hypothetical protein
MVGGRNTSWANQQVAAWRQVIQVQQQVIANQRRVATGGGSDGRGGHGNPLYPIVPYHPVQRFPKDIIPEWIKAGLIDESKVRKDKFGASKKSLEPGAIVGADTYMSNPFEWVQKHVVPILEKEGILDD